MLNTLLNKSFFIALTLSLFAYASCFDKKEEAPAEFDNSAMEDHSDAPMDADHQDMGHEDSSDEHSH